MAKRKIILGQSPFILFSNYCRVCKHNNHNLNVIYAGKNVQIYSLSHRFFYTSRDSRVYGYDNPGWNKMVICSKCLSKKVSELQVEASIKNGEVAEIRDNRGL